MGDENSYGELQNPGSGYTSNQTPGLPSASPSKPKIITVKAVVGEKISMDASTLFIGLAVLKVSWDVPPSAIRRYDNTFTFGRIIHLEPIDKTKQKLQWFWIEGGPKVVKATVTFNWAGLPLIQYFQWNFDVDAPKLIRLEAKTTRPTLRKDGTKWNLQFKNGKAPGIIWNWEVEAPATSAGYIKDLQTVKPGGRIKDQEIPGKTETRRLEYRSSLGSADLLDDNAIEGSGHRTEPGYDIVIAERPIKAEAGKSEPYSGISDSPGGQLNPLDLRVWVKEDFKYYVLFKPDKLGAIWVPVGKAEWFWQAEAVRKKGSWRLKSASGGLSKKGQPTNEFPLYEGNGSNHNWLAPQ